MSSLKAPVSLLILSGGQSSRMGTDKAWLELGGEPMIAHVALRALPLAAELIIGTNAPDRFAEIARRFPVPSLIVADRLGSGPLAGLHAGLSAATSDVVIALGADMPFVDTRVLAFLVASIDGYDAVVPQIPSRSTGAAELEPLHAVYRKSCLPAIEEQLRAGRRRMTAFLASVHAFVAPQEQIAALDPQFRSFANINTPEDLAAARQWFAPDSR
jgi:molybdopterin-guanine dinucleotide biosynthesis protein A